MKKILFLLLLIVSAIALNAQDGSPDMTNGIIRTDGMYYAQWKDGSYNYIRFYKDGQVINCTSVGMPEVVAQWFSLKHKLSARGIYQLSGNNISFEVDDKNGKIIYTGQIDGNSIKLISESLITNRNYVADYRFVPVEFGK